ncbi:PREDICTED: uncharacterized protein LOC108545473 [Eufriesea mexicana]|uniref:uncharacterized protein LOC108545473 n=1 Tax=Eufriesea mexicana TaxID=516756 RepID=UPI00083C3D0B|nr:PREDICTED: uncharacterized protein LOC108545473 [Eufriesea mexicana]XP_017752596.1 PREDICTED: uncharacterized protein LOC108545473 [Eufriesea mexicana]XP_017752598.1 PREDICTED: uncharacterized protein LOC108545473 [Eufriesea mexicana]XP_017752599.1 PREDICTED: uncharacterized protein LOC108545473 [Eufriesea mexicana]XP_017752600.1 PREDICTED: uncharacterized protein LOC108545473 [Eufriesea mexicana]XP_017752601.1 PREDICTED: uncharacterized protein LOC108545473 [Eufriesea mexicana]XP_01775260
MDRIYVDEETGESIIVPASESEIQQLVSSINNAETGEPEINVIGTAKSRRIRFQIPKEVKETLSTKDGSLKKSENLMDLEPVPVGTSFGQVNPICLFFLTVLCFRWFLPVLMFFEMSLHVWAHHKNKTLKDANVYFRSPFHGISSEFCALCQNETCMNRVDKMQQIRMHKFLRECNYMKRVVT